MTPPSMAARRAFRQRVRLRGARIGRTGRRPAPRDRDSHPRRGMRQPGRKPLTGLHSQSLDEPTPMTSRPVRRGDRGWRSSARAAADIEDPLAGRTSSSSSITRTVLGCGSSLRHRSAATSSSASMRTAGDSRCGVRDASPRRRSAVPSIHRTPGAGAESSLSIHGPARHMLPPRGTPSRRPSGRGSRDGSARWRAGSGGPAGRSRSADR